MRIKHAFTIAAIASFAVSCGEGGGTTPNSANNGEVPDGQSVVISEHLQVQELTEASFFEVLARHDFNGDRMVDRNDYDLVVSCVSDSTFEERPECDVVPDGVLNSADARLLDLIIGSSEASSAEDIARLVETLEGFADGEYTTDSAPLFVDYDGSGEPDADDIRLVADRLRNDPVSKYDFNEDGILDLRDVRVIAENMEVVTGEAAPARFDVSADGVVDDTDLTLLGELATYSSTIQVGLLDHDFDGALTLSDYCVVSPLTAEANLLGLITNEDVANIEAQNAFCRADGRSLLRNPLELNTGQQMITLPTNLYLEEVTTVPAGMGGGLPPADEDVLFVVTTTETERPVQAMILPGLTGFEDETPRIELGGAALPAGATLVTPTALVPMAAANARRSLPSALTRSGNSGEYQIEIIETITTREEAGEARDFEAKINEALATYDSYISQCPCTLEAPERAQLVQGLLRMKNCLGAVRSAAQSALQDARANHGKLTRESVFRGQMAALQWQLLSDIVMDIEWVKTLLMVLEASYDWGTGGPAEALAGQLSNLAGELANDNGLANDFWDTTSPSSPGGDLLTGMAVGEAAGMVSGPLTDAMEQVLAKGGKRLGPKAFGKAVLDNVGRNVGSYNPPNMEAFLKSVIKALPGLYLDYVKAEAFQREHEARDAAGAYNRSVYAIGNWENVVKSMDGAIAATDSKLDQLLGKFAADGCPMTISSSDPCQPGLDAALEQARMKLESDLDAANAQIDAALSQLTSSDAQVDCVSGEQRRLLDQVRLDSADRSRAVAELVNRVDAESVQEQLDIELRESAANSKEAKDRRAAACFALWLESPRQSDEFWKDLKDGQDAKQKALDDHDQAVKDAIAAYQNCAVDGGGTCSSSSTTAASTPWTAAAGCASCVPQIAMDCGSEVPDDFISLGGDFGLDEMALQGGYIYLDIPTFEHSSDEIGAKDTAGDHTTIDGLFRARINLTGDELMMLDAAYPCSDSEVFCGGLGIPPEGFYELIMVHHIGTLLLMDTNFYQYAAVFDVDGIFANNYSAAPPYSDDYFDATDTWYQFTSDSMNWSFSRTSTMEGSPMTTMTDARLIVSGNTLAYLIPSSELHETDYAAGRVSAFRHTGDYGITSMDYDGSVWPAKGESLYTPE